MSSHMKTIIYEKLHQNLRGAVHLLGERRQNDPGCRGHNHLDFIDFLLFDPFFSSELAEQ